MAHLNLALLGYPSIKKDGIRVHTATRKAAALLIYLTITQQKQSRESLMALFWPESDTKRARASLRRALSNLKKAIGEGWLIVEQDGVSLNPQANIQVDVWSFRQHIKDNSHYTQAVAYYEDDFLAGFSLNKAPAFDEWLFFEREALRQSLMYVLDSVIEQHVKERLFEEAIPYGRKRLALDPLHEPTHAQLMRLYAQSGQQAAALRQYKECQQLLIEELAIAVSPATTELYTQIKNRQFHQPTPLSSPHLPTRHNLPELPTSFVGREQEVEELTQKLIQPQTRLVTVIGLGGVGKTRLALQVARSHINQFDDGVWLIDLISVPSNHTLITHIAQALNISLKGIHPPQQQLLEAIAEKKMLWVLDNFEHLLEGAPLLSELLRHTPHLKMLVTSRSTLHLPEEWLYQVTGLSYPTVSPTNDGQTKALPLNGRYSAIDLFIQRARQVKQDFTYLAQQQEVITICQLVEGLPLALELAATWVRLLNCGQIVAEIEQNLDILANTQRNVPERHRSIRAVFDYSWQLLSPSEQIALANLSIFRGTFTAEAAQMVAGVSIFTLYSLANKSLIRAHGDGWYQLHELLRQFAAEKLDDPTPLHEKHMHYYTTFVYEREEALFGGEQTAVIERIHQDIANVYQAWLWAAQNGRFADLNRAFHGLYNYHAMQGFYYQGEQLFQQTLPFIEPYLTIAKQEARTFMVRLMVRRGEYLYTLSKLSDAGDSLRQALSLAEQLEMTEYITLATQTLGVILYLQGHYAEAKQRLTQASEMAKAQNNRHRQAYTSMSLGAIEQALGNYEQAQQQHQHSLNIYEELDYQWGIANCLRFFGITAYRLGQHDKAQTYFQKSLDICQTLNHTMGMAVVNNYLGMISQALDNPQKAHQQYQQSLMWGQESQVHFVQAVSLQNLGRIMIVLEQPQQADSYFHQALELAVQTEATPLILDVLLDIVPQLEAGGQTEQAHKLVNFIEQHPASSWETQTKAKELQNQLPAPSKVQTSLPKEASQSVALLQTNGLQAFINHLMAF